MKSEAGSQKYIFGLRTPDLLNKIISNLFCQLLSMYYICPLILRGGAVVARWAHNPKVGGSNPSSAT